MRNTNILIAVIIGLLTSANAFADGSQLNPFDWQNQDPCTIILNHPGCVPIKDLKDLIQPKEKLPFIPAAIVPPPQSDATACPKTGLPKELYLDKVCCADDEITIVLGNGPPYYGCQVIADEKAGSDPEPEPTPKKDDGPKCSANQYLFGGTLCCDLTTEVPDPLSQTCKKKVLTAPPPPPAPTIIPPVGEEETGQSANGESNCALRPDSADGTPRIAFGSAWLVVLAALFLMVIRTQTQHNRRDRS